MKGRPAAILGYLAAGLGFVPSPEDPGLAPVPVSPAADLLGFARGPVYPAAGLGSARGPVSPAAGLGSGRSPVNPAAGLGSGRGPRSSAGWWRGPG